MAYIEQWFGEFEKGNLYALATRPGVGKTHFTLTLAGHWAKLGRKTLYISDSMDKNGFERRLDAIEPYYHENIDFKECYKLTVERLSQWLDAHHYDLVVLDSFDVYAWNVDVGELKELAKEKGVCVWLTKSFSFSEESINLSHLRFPKEEFKDKFIAYVDVILCGYRHLEHDSVCLRALKNVAGVYGQELELHK
jgi:hypothetical protein